ncbi:MAG TPA: hypothetical protein V6D15_21870 [Oculatellaceae cyanobacterium]|jgi:hypothetical protein
MNRRLIGILGATSIIATVPLSTTFTNLAPVAAQSSTLAPKLNKILPKIKRQTRVPILLPSNLQLPASPTVYVEGAGNKNGYDIYLSFTPNCQNANVCTLGFIGAKRGTQAFYPGESVAKKIPLTKGVTGFFNPMRCGASCAAPYIEWTYKGVRYLIEYKEAGSTNQQQQAFLTKLAKSAINADSR